jgi:hypothetical protein
MMGKHNYILIRKQHLLTRKHEKNVNKISINKSK